MLGALRFAYVALFALAGCTAIKPVPLPERALPVFSRAFSHEDFDRVLRRFVDDQGQVDYRALKNEPSDLERYYLLLSTYSPDSHPELFPTQDSRLAYWINAYNAAAIKTVLTYYPITGVGAIEPPFPLFFFPSKSGFFFFQRVTFGRKETSLYYLEHGVIRKRFTDPRVHFALNCASRGCPRLPMSAFSAGHLNEQLDHEARKFVAEERNLRIDHQARTVFLSSIFDWYEDDFLEWYRHRFPGQEATLLDYAALYAPPARAAELKRSSSYTIRFVPYDWRLNDQNSHV